MTSLLNGMQWRNLGEDGEGGKDGKDGAVVTLRP